jgi:hypothetical protein
MLHSFPFLIPDIHIALRLAYVVVFFERIGIAFIRYPFMKTPLATTIIQVILGGGIVFAIGILLDKMGG